MTVTQPAKKVKKIDTATRIFERHLPNRDTMTKKEFRALVVADMKKELGVSNAGTLGMYFAWSDQLITGRAAKQYNRVAGRKPKSVPEAAATAPKVKAPTSDEDDKLNKLANAFIKAAAPRTAAAKKAVSKKAPAKKAEAKKSAITGK